MKTCCIFLVLSFHLRRAKNGWISLLKLDLWTLCVKVKVKGFFLKNCQYPILSTCKTAPLLTDYLTNRRTSLRGLELEDDSDLLCGSDDEVCQRVFPLQLVSVQRLVGHQEAVVQHVELLQEVTVQLHLTGKPGFLPTCNHHNAILVIALKKHAAPVFTLQCRGGDLTRCSGLESCCLSALWWSVCLQCRGWSTCPLRSL